MDRRRELHNFLLAVFTEDDLRRFVKNTFGHAIAHQIPRAESTAGLIDNVIELGAQHGLIGPELFVPLLQRYPALTDRLLALARMWCPAEAVESYVRTQPSSGPAAALAMAPDAACAAIGLTWRLAQDCTGWAADDAGEVRRRADSFSELCFDLTILNRGHDPLLIAAIGVVIDRVLEHPPAPDGELSFSRALLRPLKIAVFDVLTVTLPPLAEFTTPGQWVVVQKVLRVVLQDPVMLPGHVAVRYKLAIAGTVSARARTLGSRLLVTTDAGTMLAPLVLVHG